MFGRYVRAARNISLRLCREATAVLTGLEESACLSTTMPLFSKGPKDVDVRSQNILSKKDTKKLAKCINDAFSLSVPPFTL